MNLLKYYFRLKHSPQVNYFSLTLLINSNGIVGLSALKIGAISHRTSFSNKSISVSLSDMTCNNDTNTLYDSVFGIHGADSKTFLYTEQGEVS